MGYPYQSYGLYGIRGEHFQASTYSGLPKSAPTRPFAPGRYQAGRAVLLFEPTGWPNSGTGLMVTRTTLFVPLSN